MLRGLDDEKRLEAAMRLLADEVAWRLNVPVRALLGRSRTPQYVRARHLAMALCYHLLGGTVSALARVWSRDRATIYYALKTSRCRLQTEMDSHGSLIRACRMIVEGLSVMSSDTDGGTSAMLEAMRRLHRRRHADMSRLVSLGHLGREEAGLESLKLSALLRRTEHFICGVPMELPAHFNVEPSDLADCLSGHLKRLRAEASADIDALEQLERALGLRVVDLRLPEEPQHGP